MSLEAWLLFIPASFVIALVPGPSNFLTLSNGLRHGAGIASLAVFGRLIAFGAMIALTAVGLGAALAASQTAFEVIKWAGVAYMAWIGIQAWRATPETSPFSANAGERVRPSVRRLALQDFLVAGTNPKAMLIFTAVLPQFLDPAGDVIAQFLVMGPTYLVSEWLAASCYGLAGRGIGMVSLSNRNQRRLDKATGAVFLGLAATMAAAGRS